MTVSNGGIIGKLNNSSYSEANGVFNIREQEQSRRIDKWPEVIEVSVTPSVTAVNEGDTVTFDVTAKGIANGTTLYWSTNRSGVPSTIYDSSDFTPETTDGFFTVVNRGGQITRQLAIETDNNLEAGETFSISIRTGSVTGPILATSQNVTINNVMFDIQTSVNSIDPVDEGSSITFTTSYTGIKDGTQVWYEIVQVSGTVNSFDFNTGVAEFFVADSANKEVTLTIRSDQLTEGTESFFLRLRYGSLGGTILATSATFNIRDLSFSPTVTITGITPTVNEAIANNITISISPPYLVSTNLTWLVTVLSGTLDFAATTGTIFNVTNAGTFSVTALALGQGGTYSVKIFRENTLVAEYESVTVNNARVTAMTYVGTSTSATANISNPPGSQIGDIAILFDSAVGSSSTVPALVIPTNWSAIAQNGGGGTTTLRMAATYKVLAQSDLATTWTGMSSTSGMKKSLLVFRPDAPLETAIFIGNPTVQVSTSLPAAQSISANLGPVIQFAQYAASTSIASPNSSVAMNLIGDNSFHYVKFLITNSPSTSPAITVGFGADEGTNGLLSFYLSFS